jgi:2-methylaconitate cis-trans-isomerase PrpF
VKVAFVDPASSMTGQLFPTGRRCETIEVREADGTRFSVRATMIDVANPFVLVDETTLPSYLKAGSKDSTDYLMRMESIRRVGAVLMGLASSTDAAAKVRGTPKLAIISSPRLDNLSENTYDQNNPDIHVQAFSMGKQHPSLQLTGAACLASAVSIPGTVAHQLASDAKMRSVWQVSTPERTPSPCSDSDDGTSPTAKQVCISHSSGSISVDVLATTSDTSTVVNRCIVSRTARRLFEGTVYYYENRV